MKKNVLLLGALLIGELVLSQALFASDKKVVSNKNEFGGQTVEYTVLPTESDYDQFYKVIWYGDSAGNEKVIEYQLSDKVQKESGYSVQKEIYEDGCLVEYQMTYTKAEAKIRGVNSIYEKLNAYGNVSFIGFSNGKWTSYTDATTYAVKYPVLSLSYVKKQCKLEKPKSKDQNVFYFSETYSAGRSFATVVSDMEDLDETDIMTINHYAKCVGREDISELFVGKVTVKSDGQKYTLYVQDELRSYMKNGLNCFLTYGIIGRNDKLYLLSMDFDDVQQ